MLVMKANKTTPLQTAGRLKAWRVMLAGKPVAKVYTTKEISAEEVWKGLVARGEHPSNIVIEEAR